MLVAIDLTSRQATRVLEQAVRCNAKLEIEPRPEQATHLLWGSVERREDGCMRVALHDVGQDVPLTGLMGAACDVRTVLSGQLYLFSCTILDVQDQTFPERLVLSLPEIIQVANRRRFARHEPLEPVPVQVVSAGEGEPLTGSLCNVGASGLACRIASATCDDRLFIGDAVQLALALPWADAPFELYASVCNKTRCRDAGDLVVGFEFLAEPENTSTLQRLRTAIIDEAARLTEMDGDE